MKRMILILLTFAVSENIYAKNISCLVDVEIKISEMHPRIDLANNQGRLDSVKLTMPIDCASKKMIKPKTLDEAIKAIDKVLPISIKAEMVKSGDSFIYQNSIYGMSAVDDIIDFLRKSWGLSEESELCVSAMQKSGRGKGDASCGQSLIDSFISIFK